MNLTPGGASFICRCTQAPADKQVNGTNVFTSKAHRNAGEVRFHVFCPAKKWRSVFKTNTPSLKLGFNLKKLRIFE